MAVSCFLICVWIVPLTSDRSRILLMCPCCLLSSKSLQLCKKSRSCIDNYRKLPLVIETIEITLHVDQGEYHVLKHSIHRWSLYSCDNKSRVTSALRTEAKSIRCSLLKSLIPILSWATHNPVLIRTDLGIGLLTFALACYCHLSVVTCAGHVCSILSHFEWILRSGC